MLFACAIPYYHFGFRATMPAGKHFNGGFQFNYDYGIDKIATGGGNV